LSPAYQILVKRHRVVLSNPVKTKAIASAKIKSDKVDARILAYLLRGDLVAEANPHTRVTCSRNLTKPGLDGPFTIGPLG